MSREVRTALPPRRHPRIDLIDDEIFIGATVTHSYRNAAASKFRPPDVYRLL